MFQKKNLLQFTFEKNNLLCKKREKNNLSQGKIPAPPPLDMKWSVPKSVISTQNLIEQQSNDKELFDWFKMALTPVEAEKASVDYLIKNNILKMNL